MKTSIRFAFRSSAAIAAMAAAGLYGCLSDAGPESARGPVPPADHNVLEGIYGSMIYAKDLGGAHRVEFYDLGGGSTAIREMGSVDEPARPIMHTLEFRNLQDAFRKLNPEAPGMPEAIRLADQAALANAWRPHESDKAFTVVPSGMKPALAKSAAVTCGPDYNNDGWGANWFKSNFCTEGAFRWCEGNMGSAWSGWYTKSWAKWMQNEGDFHQAGRIKGEVSRWQWFPPGYNFKETWMEHELPPRRWEAWTAGGGRDRFQFWATSPCGHAHVNFMWN